MDLFDKVTEFTTVDDLVRAGIYPYFTPIEESEGTTVEIHGRRLLMLGSNNYLGVTHEPTVVEAGIQATKRYGSGCTGSRFLNGTLALHTELEERLARFLKKDAALVFTTGYQTNLGVISALVGRKDSIFTDRENHASIMDGCRLSFGEILKFRHNDMADLEAQLQRHGARIREGRAPGGKLIVVDGVYSMLGDLAPLPEIVRLAKRYGARILVDDAHSIGVFGPRGAGTAEHFGLEDEIDLVLGTFSKSLGSVGGYVAGKADVIDYVKHKARSMIFSAALPAPSVAAVCAALDIVENQPERRQRLHANADYLRRAFVDLGFQVGPGKSPVIPLIIGSREATFHFWKELFAAGVFTNPVTAPAVPEGMDLLRCSVMATHTQDQLERVVDIVSEVAKKLRFVA